jgi:hypothetical protein
VPQLQCVTCGSQLTPEDMYCGACGTPAGPAGHGGAEPAEPVQVNAMAPGTPRAGIPAQAPAWWQATPPEPARPEPARPGPARTEAAGPGRPEPTEVIPADRDQFFGHAVAEQGGPLSNATRYLCAAAYLDRSYANTVIGELLGSHRAVAPSLGVDLVPVIRHCLNARSAQLLRDVLVTVLLLAGLFLATAPTIAILVISLCLSFLPGVQWERRSLGVKVLAGAVIALVLVAIVLYYLVGSVIRGTSGGAVPNFGPVAAGTVSVFVVLGLLVLVGATLVGYSYSMFRTFSDVLRPGADAGRFSYFPGQELEDRIAEVAAAQRGNMAIYGGENPFVGTGPRILNENWSIAIELDRAPGPGKRSSWPEAKSSSYVPIDPVELYQVIRARLLKVRDTELPENERITSLSMHDHVVGDGHCRWDSPVIDQARKIPHSQASPEAISALIRHPAAGLRYYLRVCVSDEGQPVWARQREVIGSADQEVAVSAFVYVAVEGRMFYLQFVPTILPPVRQDYHIVDRLPKVTSGEFMVKVMLHAASTSFRDMVRAPFGLIGTTCRIIAERWAFRRETKSASDYIFADVGARISVREFGGAPAPRTYIQWLDAAKYTRIVQRLILDTVLDFLKEKGVDTSAYQESANAIISNSYTIHGDVGSMATGSHGRAEMHVNRASGSTAGSKS